MNRRRAATAAFAILAPGLLAATRLPSAQPVVGLAALAFTVAAVALGLLGALRPRWQWTAPAGLAAGLGLLAVPASRAAPLHGLPAALAAGPMLVLVHLLYSVKEDAAPRLGPQQGRWAQTVARLGPLAAGLAFLALFPWLVHRLAPARVAAVHELAGPAAAIVAAILVAALFGTLALARAVLAFAAGRRRRTDVEAQAAAFEPEGAA